MLFSCSAVSCSVYCKNVSLHVLNVVHMLIWVQYIGCNVVVAALCFVTGGVAAVVDDSERSSAHISPRYVTARKLTSASGTFRPTFSAQSQRTVMHPN